MRKSLKKIAIKRTSFINKKLLTICFIMFCYIQYRNQFRECQLLFYEFCFLWRPLVKLDWLRNKFLVRIYLSAYRGINSKNFQESHLQVYQAHPTRVFIVCKFSLHMFSSTGNQEHAICQSQSEWEPP